MSVRALLHGLVGDLAGAILVVAGQVYGQRASPRVTQNVLGPLVGNNDGPLEFATKNESSGRYAMTEVRAGNDGQCFNDFLVTGSNYNDPGDGTLEANEASIVSESPCTRMHIKTNSGEIKFTTVAPGKTSANLRLRDGVVHLAIADCTRAASLSRSAPAIGAIGATSGNSSRNVVKAADDLHVHPARQRRSSTRCAPHG